MQVGVVPRRTRPVKRLSDQPAASECDGGAPSLPSWMWTPGRGGLPMFSFRVTSHDKALGAAPTRSAPTLSELWERVSADHQADLADDGGPSGQPPPTTPHTRSNCSTSPPGRPASTAPAPWTGVYATRAPRCSTSASSSRTTNSADDACSAAPSPPAPGPWTRGHDRHRAQRRPLSSREGRRTLGDRRVIVHNAGAVFADGGGRVRWPMVIARES
jgi:hypothetical protein